MNIFVALNDTYFPQLMVFISTIAKHMSKKINLTVLYTDLKEKNKSRATKYATSKGISITFRNVNDQRFSNYQLIYNITKETYYRFLVLEVYPTEERAMWMDIDTIVLRDISPFYNMNLGDNYIAGSYGNHVHRHLRRLGLNENGEYINAGIILFNLKKIREDFEKEFLFKCYEENESKISLADQDIINIAFADRIIAMPDRRYNYVVSFGQKFDNNSLEFVKEHAVVIHFIRHIKPWHKEYMGVYKHLYRKTMFPLFPIKTIWLTIQSFFYQFKRNKKTLENSDR